jgi:hypothetical protein
MSPTICIIKSTNNDNEKHYGIEAKDWNETFLSHYNLKDNISEYTQFVKLTTIYDLFTSMNVMINPTDYHVVNIEDVFYTYDYVLQAIFKTVAKDVNCSYNSLIEDSNKLATQMLGERHIVDGNMIIIKRSIINTDFSYEEVTMDDITDILRNQIIHTAVVVDENNTIEQNYIYNPLEINFGQSHIDNVRYHECRFLDYRLFFHVDTKAERTKLNKIASVIYGQNIYGNVIISLSDNSDSSPLNLNITSELINQIYKISLYNRINKTEIDRKKYARNMEIKNKDFEDYDPSKHTTFEHNNFPEITMCPNFFQLIKLEYNDIKDKIIQSEDMSFENTLNDIL